MKQLLLFLLLLITANAKVAVLDVILSSQLEDGGNLFPSQANYASASAKGCLVRNFDGSAKAGATGTGDCPTGSACIDGAVPICKTLTKEVHQGANGYDFETENVVNAPTQIANLVTFSTDVADAAQVTGTQDKFLLYRVHLQNVNKDKYDGCHVEVGGALVDAVVLLGSPAVAPSVLTGGVLGHDGTNPTTADKQFLSETGKVSCEFRLANQGYLGLVSLNVTFSKVELQLDIGEKPFDSVEAHVRFVPSDDDIEWHNPAAADAGTTIPLLFPDHTIATTASSGNRYKSADGITSNTQAVFLFSAHGDYTDGYKHTEATALKGTVNLPVKGTFFDKRYKIADQSGAESLRSGVGDGAMRKEGMDIHFDFVNFYDASLNSFLNKQINMDPVALYSGYRADGPGNGYAQYQLEHTYVMKYGGSDGNEMPHFQKEYLSCPLCDAKIVFKAFKKDNAYAEDAGGELAAVRKDYLLRYHTAIVTSNLPTATNTISLADVDVDIVSGVNGHSKDASGNNIALRLPTTLDPQYPDGHPIGEFFTVKKAATNKVYTSLVSDYEILDTRLVASSAGTGAPTLVGCGVGYGSGPLYKLGTDIVGKAQEIFDRDCRVQIPTTSFGDDSVLTYKNAAGVDSVSTILQTDDRQIMAGNTELSILRRKTDTSATNSGPQVTFSVSKVGVSGAVDFTIKGSNTMLGYGNDGVACTQAQVCQTSGLKENSGVCEACATAGDCSGGASAGEADTHAGHVAAGKQCRDVLKPNENKVKTSAVDGVSKTVTIRSSSDCFLYMDVELQDDAAQFASYALRLPCVRTTDQLNDALNLTYGFSTSYSLSKDQVTAEIDYALPTGMDLRIKNKGFGQCGKNASNFDVLLPPSTCADVSGEAQPIDGWADDGTSEIVLDKDDKVDLATLKLCDTAAGAVQPSADGNSYILNHYLGLVYARDYFSGGRTMARTYCQDQKFVTTIRRDATASVTVATLVSPTLARSVMVSGLNWVQCSSSDQNCKGSANCYKYRIDLDVTEQSDGGAWGNATLSSAFLPAAGGANTDSMSIIETLASNTHKNYMSLESACGPVDSCDSNSDHYSDIVDGTEQDIVIRGAFEGVDVDTAVNIQTKFEECPLEKATVDLGGELKVGMGLLCAKSDGSNGYEVYGTGAGGGGAKSAVDSKVSVDDGSNSQTEVAVKRCASALASSKVKASAQVFLDGLNSTGLANAVNAKWHFKDIDFTIQRFEKDLLGQKDESKLISSDLMMEMRWKGTDYDCERKNDKLFGLPNAFDNTVLACPGSADSGATSAGQTETAISVLEFDLAPLQSANMDVFEVRVDAIMRNVDLDATRRLRGVIPLYLRADGSVEASSGSFEVLPASKDISDAMYESPDTPDKKTANNTEVIMIISISVLALIVLVLAIRCCLSKSGLKNKSRAMAGMDEEETKPLTGSSGPSGKEAKFSNLRY
tara:strand:+ start:78 stop:4415 length:4338 start_codon:yes stop_codon:yes gene_type:complete